MTIEFQIGWSASSNATFGGETDWMPWHGDETTTEAVQEALNRGIGISLGLEEALDASGFEWWSETREAPNG